MAKLAVRYVGPSTYRGLTAKEMDDLGLKVDLDERYTPEFFRRVVGANSWVESESRPLDPAQDLVWGPFNDWTLIMDVKPDFERWLRSQEHFALVEITDTGEQRETVGEPGPDADHPGDTIVTHVEGEPGQKAEAPREETGDGPAPTPESSTDAGSAGAGGTLGGSTASNT